MKGKEETANIDNRYRKEGEAESQTLKGSDGYSAKCLNKNNSWKQCTWYLLNGAPEGKSFLIMKCEGDAKAGRKWKKSRDVNNKSVQISAGVARTGPDMTHGRFRFNDLCEGVSSSAFRARYSSDFLAIKSLVKTLSLLIFKETWNDYLWLRRRTFAFMKVFSLVIFCVWGSIDTCV